MNISFKFKNHKTGSNRSQIEKIEKIYTQDIPDPEPEYIDVKARPITSYEWEKSSLKSEDFSQSSTVRQKSKMRSHLIAVVIATMGLASGGFWWLTQEDSSKSNVTDKKTSIFLKNDLKKKFPSGEFAYGGSAAWAPIRQEVDSILQNALAKFQLRYIPSGESIPGSHEGIEMLLNNQLAFIQSARPLHSNEYSKALQQGFSISEIAVGFEGIAIATHPDLNIPGLTLTQLKDIYIGRITNWKQVGGPDLKIIPYSLSVQDSGTAEFFDDSVMEGLPFGKNTLAVSTTTEALHQVAKHPGSIFYGPAPEITNQCTVKPIPIGTTSDKLVPPYQEPLVLPQECPAKRNQLNMEAMQGGKYSLIQPLYVVIKHDAQADEQAGVAYANWLLTEQGQKLLQKAGFIPLKKF